MDAPLKVFSGSSHPELAQSICDKLGIDLGKSHTVTFSNENMMVQIDENVRECDVFVVQTSTPPVHTHLFELLMIIDALRSASAARITAVMPYIPYIRSDKKDRPRISITARLVADLLETAGADRVLTMDMHTPQAQGFFRIPVDHLMGVGPICERLERDKQDDWILVAADIGEAKDIGKYANRLNLPFAIIDKRREGDDDKPKAVNLIGDVSGKTALVVDDEIASGGTLCEAALYLKAHGAERVIATATHGVLSGKAIERIEQAFIEKVIVTDTIPLARDKRGSKVEVLSVASMFAAAITRIHDGRSVSALF
ncbi:ribose-phosphate pyrophosphokinase [Microvenator marinus]|jgi:ribose-phosphate pyrophosphokinase|uniref:ribose-phosphate diphosphokinase n=1 Tax=Microvenator marinus TaxID=2600177 RepID=A0A5B8XQR7_9DELT|nr:ribose-phosphate pyrophosphokinase [Microvenator marinus]QED25749.1 ribose-phosphate pyrophosphokinase [Microvenator marinus]